MLHYILVQRWTKTTNNIKIMKIMINNMMEDGEQKLHKIIEKTVPKFTQNVVNGKKDNVAFGIIKNGALHKCVFISEQFSYNPITARFIFWLCNFPFR